MRRLPICCEEGCTKPIDHPRSKARCAEHYTPPTYDGHPHPDRRRRSSHREEEATHE